MVVEENNMKKRSYIIIGVIIVVVVCITRAFIVQKPIHLNVLNNTEEKVYHIELVFEYEKGKKIEQIGDLDKKKERLLNCSYPDDFREGAILIRYQDSNKIKHSAYLTGYVMKNEKKKIEYVIK